MLNGDVGDPASPMAGFDPRLKVVSLAMFSTGSPFLTKWLEGATLFNALSYLTAWDGEESAPADCFIVFNRTILCPCLSSVRLFMPLSARNALTSISLSRAICSSVHARSGLRIVSPATRGLPS